MAANLKHGRTPLSQPALAQVARSATEIPHINRDPAQGFRQSLSAVPVKVNPIFQKLSKSLLDFTGFRRFLRTRRAILNGEKLFDLSNEELKARKLVRPLTFNVYKAALAALPAIAIGWLIFWSQRSDLNTSLGMPQAGTGFWSGLLAQWQVVQTLRHTVTALVAPAAPFVFAVVVSRLCLHRSDSKRETRWRCRRAFLYFDGAYGVLPQMLLSTVLILYENSDWLSAQIWNADSYSVFNFVMGFPLGVAGFWPAYVLFAQIPELLFDVNGYGEPEGIVSASARRPRPWRKFLCGVATITFAVGSLLTLALPADEAYEAPVPPPLGPFPVGRISYDWVDPARPELLAQIPNASREIMVYVWYPAAAVRRGTPTAQYFPGAEKIDKGALAEIENANWGNAWRSIVSGNVHTQAYENAPVASSGVTFPLIIFSPGYRTEPFGYTHQIEELVSRGYVVAAVQHTYEAGVTTFPDGRMVPFSEEIYRQSHIHQTINEFRKWEDERINVWAADILFTLDQITRLNMGSPQKAPFAGWVDLGRVGVFGHSFGGAAAARACQLDQRIKACLNQDGIPMDGPFLLYEGPILRHDGGYMPAQAFMFLRGGSEPPSEAAVNVFQAMIDKELQDCCAIAYEVRTPVRDNSDFTDRPLLQAAGKPHDTARALESLRIVESYTNAFFDKFLSDAQHTLIDRDLPRDGDFRIKRYVR